MNKNFTPVSLDGSRDFYSLWQRTPRRSLDYTLPNLWGWQEYYGLEWCFDDALCWIRQTRPRLVCWAPMGDWSAVDWSRVLPAVFSEAAHDFVRVPEELLRIWQEALPGLVDPEEDRGQWEYLYKQEELADLPGNRFHKKRNHINSYIKASANRTTARWTTPWWRMCWPCRTTGANGTSARILRRCRRKMTPSTACSRTGTGSAGSTAVPSMWMAG